MSNSERAGLPSRRRKPDASDAPFRVDRLVVEIVGSLVMLVLMNFFALWYLGRYSTNYGYWTLHQKWALLGKLEAPVDWLILGDSSCNQGVSPAMIAQELGGAALNLCTIGNVTALNDLWMLEEYLEQFEAPKAVVVIHVYDIWARDLDPVILGQIPRPWGFWKAHTLGNELMVDPAIRTPLLEERFIPLLSQRRTLTEILRSSLFGKLVPFREKWQMTEEGFLVEKTAMPEIAAKDGEDHMQFVRENEPEISSINQSALEELKRIAEAYQLPIYLVNSPLYEGLNADDGFQRYLAAIQAQMEAIVGQSQYFHLVPEVKTFPASQLQTADHLIVDGAQIYTEWLIQEVLSR